MNSEQIYRLLINYSIPVIVATVVLAAFALFALMRRERPPRYAACASLLTESERVFHAALEAAAGRRYRIMCKVRMADILQPAGGLEPGERQSALNRISSKHLDFVLCEPDNFHVAAAIELDDRSHLRKDRQERDAFVEAAFEEAGVVLLRFSVRAKYDPGAIAADVAAATEEARIKP